jgi:hypothetical protein
MKFLILIAALAWTSLALIQTLVPEYGQCGGLDYTGAYTCVSGTVCTEINIYFSMNQSLPSYVEKNFSDN